MGPGETTGKWGRPTTMMTTPKSSPANSGVAVGNVPAVAGTGCLRASDPAMPSTATIATSRPISMVRPSMESNQSGLAVGPPNAAPLLLNDDVHAQTISDS